MFHRSKATSPCWVGISAASSPEAQMPIIQHDKHSETIQSPAISRDIFSFVNQNSTANFSSKSEYILGYMKLLMFSPYSNYIDYNKRQIQSCHLQLRQPRPCYAVMSIKQKDLTSQNNLNLAVSACWRSCCMHRSAKEGVSLGTYR